MTDAEIMRRLKALIATPRDKRPIAIHCLEVLAGLGEKRLYSLARGNFKMHKRTREALARAFTLVENDQVVVTRAHRGGGWDRRPGEPDVLTIVEPKPPCVAVPRVRLTATGPRLEYVAQNPRAFPVLDEINRRWAK